MGEEAYWLCLDVAFGDFYGTGSKVYNREDHREIRLHLNSKLLFERYAKTYFKSGMEVLEIGPDEHPSTYKKLVGDATIKWQTLDLYESGQLTYVAKTDYEFPIPDESFDIVLSGQVIEHVRKIWLWIREVARVCKTGGYVITINPVNWDYHLDPVDCWRIYPEGMKAIYEEAEISMQFSKFESLETFKHRVNLAGVKWMLKTLLKRPLKLEGEPFLAVDTISIGVKAKRC